MTIQISDRARQAREDARSKTSGKFGRQEHGRADEVHLSGVSEYHVPGYHVHGYIRFGGRERPAYIAPDGVMYVAPSAGDPWRKVSGAEQARFYLDPRPWEDERGIELYDLERAAVS